ncbi:unnamed protein product, partial [Rotaria sp. Silwood1]
MKEIFYTKLDAYLSALSVKRRSKYLTTAETYDKVLKVLTNEKKYDPSFNFWAKRPFTVVTFGGQRTIYCKKEKLPIVIYENLFQTIDKCHNAVGHLGRNIVGLKVSDVDRKNTSSTILPCKIVDKYSKNAKLMHIIATQNGIIKEHFDSTAFLDLTNANFASLRSINTNELPSITFIQASQIYTNFKLTET